MAPLVLLREQELIKLDKAYVEDAGIIEICYDLNVCASPKFMFEN
jgi:hypothetical protein